VIPEWKGSISIKTLDYRTNSGYTSSAMTLKRAATWAVITLPMVVGLSGARQDPATQRDWRETGRSEPTFQVPSLAPGVDYTLPSEADIRLALDQVRDRFVKATPYRVVDSATGQVVTDFTTPKQTVGIDQSTGEWNDWTYSMGVVLAGMLHASDVTGDKSFENYALKNFDFIFEHYDYFKRQAAQFGPQPNGYRRLMNMTELDDAGAIGAALIKAYAKKTDPKYRVGIDVTADFISNKMTRLPDGTLARRRPQWPTVWSDDAYMSIPFLAQMGKLTGEKKYYDDAAHQVIKFAEHLMDENGIFEHAWFVNAGKDDPKFH